MWSQAISQDIEELAVARLTHGVHVEEVYLLGIQLPRDRRLQHLGMEFGQPV